MCSQVGARRQVVRRARNVPGLSPCMLPGQSRVPSPGGHGSLLCWAVAVTEHFLLAGKSKKEDGVKEDKRKRGSSTQPPKPAKSSAGGRPSQQPTPPQQATPGQPQQGAFIAHKEIKLTLLNKVRLVFACPSVHWDRAPARASRWPRSLRVVAGGHPSHPPARGPHGKWRGARAWGGEGAHNPHGRLEQPGLPALRGPCQHTSSALSVSPQSSAGAQHTRSVS